MKKNTISVLVWLSLLVLMVCGGIAAGYYTFLERNPGKLAAQEQVEMVREGHISQAYELLMSDRYRHNTSLEAFSEWIQNHPEILSHTGTKFTLLPDGQIEVKLLFPKAPAATFVYEMVKEGENWKIDAMRVENSEALSHFLNEKNDVLLAIQEYLMHLKHLNLKTAYELLSPEFQELVSFQEFTNIIQENEELTDFEFIRYGNYENEGDLRRIELNLLKDDENHFVTFWLSHTDSDWKVWAIEVKGPTAQGLYEVGELEEKPAVTGQPPSFTSLVRDQLDTIKKGNIEEAYQKYTAEEFKKATPFEDFKTFVSNYPEFTKFTDIRLGEKVENEGLYLQNVTLISEEGESQVDFWIAKENGDWKIWGIRIDESAFFPPISEEARKEIVELIEEQLGKMRENELKAAYENYTAKAFRDNTSFEKFEEFVEENPVFKQNAQVTTGMGIQEGDLHLLRVALQSPEETQEIDYRLIKEDGKWKIWGIQVITNTSEVPENKEDVEKVVREQLEEIRNENYGKAYYSLTAKEFQEAASYENFKKFLDKHDELKMNDGIEIDSIKFKPSFAEVIASLKSQSGQTRPFVFRLVYETDRWKVLSIKLKTNLPPRTTPSNIDVAKAVIGTATDLNGVVRDPKTTFKRGDRELVVNLHVINGYPGDTVTVTLLHEETSSSIEPVTAELDKKGDSLLNFMFTAPTSGWPEGNYLLQVKTASGTYKVFTFKVE